VTFNLVVFPVDVIKSRQQTSLYGKNVLGIISDVYKAGGFYRGLGITLLRSVPTSGAVFYTYETLTQYFKRIDTLTRETLLSDKPVVIIKHTIIQPLPTDIMQDIHELSRLFGFFNDWIYVDECS